MNMTKRRINSWHSSAYTLYLAGFYFRGSAIKLMSKILRRRNEVHHHAGTHFCFYTHFQKSMKGCTSVHWSERVNRSIEDKRTIWIITKRDYPCTPFMSKKVSNFSVRLKCFANYCRIWWVTVLVKINRFLHISYVRIFFSYWKSSTRKSTQWILRLWRINYLSLVLYE